MNNNILDIIMQSTGITGGNSNSNGNQRTRVESATIGTIECRFPTFTFGGKMTQPNAGKVLAERVRLHGPFTPGSDVPQGVATVFVDAPQWVSMVNNKGLVEGDKIVLKVKASGFTMNSQTGYQEWNIEPGELRFKFIKAPELTEEEKAALGEDNEFEVVAAKPWPTVIPASENDIKQARMTSMLLGMKR